MKKKLLALVTATILTLGVFASCGSDNSTSASTGGTTATGGDVTTISYMMWDSSHKTGMEKVIADFEAENPDIKVDLQITPWKDYWIKLEAAVGGTSGPDMFWMNAVNVKKYNEAGLLANLTETTSINSDDYIEKMIDIYTLDDGLYTLPIFWDTTLVFVNTEILEENGIDLPKTDWSWDEMLAWTEDASQKLPDTIYPYVSAAVGDPQTTLYTFGPSNGAQIYSDDQTECVVDSAEMIEATTKALEYGNKDYCPTAEQLAETDGLKLFMTGRAAAVTGISAQVSNFIDPDLSDLQGKVAVIAYPKMDASSKSVPSVIHGVGTAINAKNKNQDACAKFVEYLGQASTLDTYTKENGVCTTGKTGSSTYVELMKTTHDIDMSVMITLSENAMPYPNALNQAKIEPIFQTALKNAYEGKMTVEEAMQDAASQVDALL